MLLTTILALMFALLFQSDSILSPTMVAVVTAIFTVVVGAIGIQFLKDKINANTRIKGLLAALVTAYGMVTPFISNFPKWVGILVAVIGLVVVMTSGRVQGPTEP